VRCRIFGLNAGFEGRIIVRRPVSVCIVLVFPAFCVGQEVQLMRCNSRRENHIFKSVFGLQRPRVGEFPFKSA
jgi:hypothetical protein